MKGSSKKNKVEKASEMSNKDNQKENLKDVPPDL